jgi:hypothetical protein
MPEPMDNQEPAKGWAFAVSRFADKSSTIGGLIELPPWRWWVKMLMVLAGLMALAAIVVKLAGAEIGELPPPVEPAPPAAPPSAAMEAALTVAAIALAAVVTAEAVGGSLNAVAVSPEGRAAIAAGIRAAMSQGGVAGTTAAISIGAIGVASGPMVALVAIVGLIGIIAIVNSAGTTVRPGNQVSFSVTNNPGNQTEGAPSTPSTSMDVSIPGEPGMTIVNLATITATIDMEGNLTAINSQPVTVTPEGAVVGGGIGSGGMVVGDVPGSPPGSAPNTGLTIGLSPVDTATPGESGPPSSPSDPAPGLDGMGLFMVVDGATGVPTLAPLWLLLTGLLGWALRRRVAC